MTAFILMDAEAFSFFVSSLFVAATMFAMQTLRQTSHIFTFWSIAFAIGGTRYLITYLVAIAGLQVTIIILDTVMITQAILMLVGTCCLHKRPVPTAALIISGVLLLAWGIATSKLAYNWLWHDIPVLLAYSAAYVISGVMFVRKQVHTGGLTSLHISVAGLVISSGILYLLLLIINPENNPGWFFVIEQGILIALGVALVFGILSNLQSQMHHISPVDPSSGAFTWTYFSHLLNTELVRAQRYKRPFAYLLVSLDTGEDNSETTGQLTKAIVKSLRDVDFIGKIDETEFAIALPETTVEEARHVADRQLALVKNINSKINDGDEISIRVVISHCEPGENAEHLYTRSKETLGRYPSANNIINSEQK